MTPREDYISDIDVFSCSDLYADASAFEVEVGIDLDQCARDRPVNEMTSNRR
jgi:hypothetical protein